MMKAGMDPIKMESQEGHEEFCGEMDSKYYGSFLGFLTINSRAVSNKKNSLATQVSYVLESRGLSMSGLTFLSGLGLGVPQQTYGRRRTLALTKYSADVEAIIKTRHAVSIWWDNYKHLKYTKMASLAAGPTTYREGAFTGVAILLGDPASDLSLVRRGQNVLPCFPPSLTVTRLVNDVGRRFLAISTTTDFWRGYLDNSYTLTEGITNVPPKPAALQVCFFSLSAFCCAVCSIIVVGIFFVRVAGLYRRAICGARR